MTNKTKEICYDCGEVYLGTAGTHFCPKCRKERQREGGRESARLKKLRKLGAQTAPQRVKPVAKDSGERACLDCGERFFGGKYARYCPRCRGRRQAGGRRPEAELSGGQRDFISSCGGFADGNGILKSGRPTAGRR